MKNSQKIALVYNTLKTIPEGFGLLDNRIKTDPIELTDKYLKIELEVERLIRKEIGEGGYMGFCHKYWWTKKNLLKEKYGIEWKKPVDMNPDVDLD